MANGKPATVKEVYDFFKETYTNLSAFSADWKTLSESDKEQIKTGIGDGSFTY